MNISEKIRALRLDRKLKQREVAEGTGIRLEHYQRYEYGRTPQLEQLIALAKFYGVSLDYLCGLTDDPTPPHPPAHSSTEVPTE